MLYFYNINQFDQWIKDFEKDLGVSIDIKDINNLKNWIYNMNGSLDEIYEMYSCSVSAECFVLKPDVIVKASRFDEIFLLHKRLMMFPEINNYIIPTYVLAIKNKHNCNKKHLQFVKDHNCEHMVNFIYSDCLILQPKCKPINNEFILDHWIQTKEDIKELRFQHEIIDLSPHNCGYFNGNIKFFDW